jgi:hypothetical protein
MPPMVYVVKGIFFNGNKKAAMEMSSIAAYILQILA